MMNGQVEGLFVEVVWAIAASIARDLMTAEETDSTVAVADLEDPVGAMAQVVPPEGPAKLSRAAA